MNDLAKRKQELLNKYEAIEDECAKQGVSWEEMQKKTIDIKEQLFIIDKLYRKEQEPIIEYGKNWNGTLMTFDEFKSKVESNQISDKDGYGFYASAKAKSNVKVLPTDILYDIYRRDFTHIIWFEN